MKQCIRTTNSGQADQSTKSSKKMKNRAHMAYFFPLPALPPAADLVTHFINFIFYLHGLPQHIVSDGQRSSVHFQFLASTLWIIKYKTPSLLISHKKIEM